MKSNKPFRFAYAVFNPEHIIEAIKVTREHKQEGTQFLLVVLCLDNRAVEIRYTDELALEDGLQQFLAAWLRARDEGEVAQVPALDVPPLIPVPPPSGNPDTQLTPEQLFQLRVAADLASPEVQAFTRLVVSLNAAQQQALLKLVAEIKNNPIA